MLANMVKDEIPFVHLTSPPPDASSRKGGRSESVFARLRARRCISFTRDRLRRKPDDISKIHQGERSKNFRRQLKYGYEFMEKVPLVKAAGFQVTLDEIGRTNPKAKQAKPQQFFDNSLIQELVDEGFFVKLWGRNP